MAFYLQFDGVNDYVTFTTANNEPVDIEIDFFTDIGRTPNTFQRIIDAQGFSLYVRNNNAITFNGDTQIAGPISFEIDGVPQNWTSNGTQYVGSGLDTMAGKTLRVNGLLSGFTHLMAKVGGTETMGGGISAVRVYPWDSATVIHNYDPTASGGTGSILPDTVGSNDGTLINFPTDDSQWIFYDDGGGVVNVTGQTATYSYSPVSATVDLTGSIDVAGDTATYSYTAQAGTVDLTSAIDIQGATATYSYESVSGSVELTGVVAVTGDTASYTYAPISGQINLQGTITITAESAQYTYSAVNANITLDSGLLITNYTAAFAPESVRAVFGKDNITARFR